MRASRGILPFECRECGFDLELSPSHDCKPKVRKVRTLEVRNKILSDGIEAIQKICSDKNLEIVVRDGYTLLRHSEPHTEEEIEKSFNTVPF